MPYTWLPVKRRLVVQIAVLVVDRGTGPASLDDIHGLSSLRASNRCDLLVPSTKTKINGRSFRIAVPIGLFSGTVLNVQKHVFERKQRKSSRNFSSIVNK